MIEIYNHQDVIAISDDLLDKWTVLANAARDAVLDVAISGERCVLPDLEEVEFSIVDDNTIAQVHGDFMDIPTATDVITFDHGEVIMSIETAHSHAVEFGEEPNRELARYIVHGLLHLAGYFDDSDERAEAMTQQQERILDELWPK